MKVLVAVDDSDESLHALSWALDNLFASPASGGSPVPPGETEQLVLLHVEHPFPHYVYPVSMYPVGPVPYPTSSVIDSVREAKVQNSKEVLARALQICRERLITAETVVSDGDPKENICQAAEQMNVDLLVVGSRGLGKIQRAFLGSVSDYCAHHAKCPVLIVKPCKENV